MKKIISLLAPALLLVGCSEPLTDHEKEIRRLEKQTQSLEKQAKRMGVEITDEIVAPRFNYEIIKDEVTQPLASQPIKRSVDVRLPERLSKPDLERLGNVIRAMSEHKERLFINYYLPEQTIGAGAWASTHFTPDLDSSIYGMTKGQANDPFPMLPQGTTLIAKYQGNEIMGQKALIIKDADGLYNQISKYKDGSSNSSRLYSKDGKRFDTRNSFGEYLVVSPTTVKSYDSDGLIDTFKRKNN